MQEGSVDGAFVESTSAGHGFDGGYVPLQVVGAAFGDLENDSQPPVNVHRSVHLREGDFVCGEEALEHGMEVLDLGFLRDLAL